MKRLLSIELEKLWKNRASKVLVITYFVLLTLIALLASVNFSIIGIDFRLADLGIFNFPFIWHANTWLASILKIFLAIVIVSMMANEYTYGTLKQNLIDGLSKKEFVLSKVLTVSLFALVSTLFIFIMTLILGYSFSSYTETSIVFTDLQYIVAYFIKLIAFFSFCLFLGVWVKRSAFAIGFILLWFIGEQVIQGLLYKFVFETRQALNQIAQFFPMESMSNLIKEPISRFQLYKTIENQIGGQASIKDYDVHWYQIAIVIFWTAFFIYMSYRILKKRDL